MLNNIVFLWITVFLRCVVISEFCRITDTPVFSGPAERRLSLASTTSAVLSVSLSQQRSQPEAVEAAAAAASAQQSPSWAEGEFPATIMSELPSGKSGGIGRERTLNGELTHQTPLPIHLAIESEDHSTDKKNAPWTQFKSLRIPGYYGRSLRWIYLV